MVKFLLDIVATAVQGLGKSGGGGTRRDPRACLPVTVLKLRSLKQVAGERVHTW